MTEFSARRSGIIGVLAAQLAAYYHEVGESPQDVRTWVLPDGPSIMETIIERALARGELATTPSARIVALPADLVRHELFMTMTAVAADTIIEIVDAIFLPLATNFADK